MPLHQIFFYLTVILLPSQLGLHTWPDWTLILGRRIDYLSPTLYLTDITISLTLILWVTSPHKITAIKIRRFLHKYLIWILIYLVFAGINVAMSAIFQIALVAWCKVTLLTLFAVYIINTKPSNTRVALLTTIPILYSSGIAIIQFFLQHSIGGLFWYLGERTFDIATPGIARINWCWFMSSSCRELLRPYATFSHPNVLAGFMSFGMLLIGWQLIIKRHQTARLFIWNSISFFLATITLVLTFSRSAWVFTIISLSLMIGLRYKKTFFQILKYSIMAVIMCVAIAFPYFSTLFTQNESVFVRQELNTVAYMLWKSYPLVGVGLNNFLVRLPEFVSSRYLFFIQPPHNIFLLILSELGIVGFLLLGVLLFRYIHFLIRHSKLIPLICVGMYILLGMVDHYLITIQQGQLLTVFIFTLGFLSN